MYFYISSLLECIWSMDARAGESTPWKGREGEEHDGAAGIRCRRRRRDPVRADAPPQGGMAMGRWRRGAEGGGPPPVAAGTGSRTRPGRRAPPLRLALDAAVRARHRPAVAHRAVLLLGDPRSYSSSSSLATCAARFLAASASRWRWKLSSSRRARAAARTDPAAPGPGGGLAREVGPIRRMPRRAGLRHGRREGGAKGRRTPRHRSRAGGRELQGAGAATSSRGGAPRRARWRAPPPRRASSPTPRRMHGRGGAERSGGPELGEGAPPPGSGGMGGGGEADLL